MTIQLETVCIGSARKSARIELCSISACRLEPAVNNTGGFPSKLVIEDDRNHSLVCNDIFKMHDAAGNRIRFHRFDHARRRSILQKICQQRIAAGINERELGSLPCNGKAISDSSSYPREKCARIERDNCGFT